MKEEATLFEDIILTKLIQSKRKEKSPINLIKIILNECSLKLNGFNIMEDKLKKESLVIKIYSFIKKQNI